MRASESAGFKLLSYPSGMTAVWRQAVTFPCCMLSKDEPLCKGIVSVSCNEVTDSPLNYSNFRQENNFLRPKLPKYCISMCVTHPGLLSSPHFPAETGLIRESCSVTANWSEVRKNWLISSTPLTKARIWSTLWVSWARKFTSLCSFIFHSFPFHLLLHPLLCTAILIVLFKH